MKLLKSAGQGAPAAAGIHYDAPMQLSSRDGAAFLPVKVVPGASRTRSVGELDGRLKIAVAAPAEKGKANVALLAYLARRIGARRSDLSVEQGLSAPQKLIRIQNLTAEQVIKALGIDNA